MKKRNNQELLNQLQDLGNNRIDSNDLSEENVDELLSLSVAVAESGLSMDDYKELYNNCQDMYDTIDKELERQNKNKS